MAWNAQGTVRTSGATREISRVASTPPVPGIWMSMTRTSGRSVTAARTASAPVDAVPTPVGLVPAPGALDLDGLDLPEETLDALFEVEPGSWLAEADLTEVFFETFGDRTPDALYGQLDDLRTRLRS